MKIATWNVAYGISPKKNERILQVMETIDADIWVLTETHDALRPPTEGSWTSLKSIDRPRESRSATDGSRWVTIWTRLPIIETCQPSYDPIRTVAGVIDTPLGHLLAFGTVLPWYQDAGRSVAEEIARQSHDWQSMRATRDDVPLCVVGDFNVNLGGPHYYGSDESKEAVVKTLTDNDLVSLTDFDHTGAAQYGEFGLIDHIAASRSFATTAQPPEVWQRENDLGEVMSDHCGVAVTFQE